MFASRTGPLSGRQDANSARSPCPSSNGSTIGSQQLYTLFCGLDVVGYDLVAYHADNLTTCVDACSRNHPKCYAAAFEASQDHGANNCYLKSHAAAPQSPAYPMDAVVLNDSVTSKRDCPQLGATYQARTSGGSVFNTSCGFDYPRDDLRDEHAESLAECIDICSTYVDGSQGCTAVSYEAKQLNGYNNCYLKKSFSTAGLSAGKSIMADTAYLVSAASSSPSPSSADTSTLPGSTSAAGSGGTSTGTSAGGLSTGAGSAGDSTGTSAGGLSPAAIGGAATGGAAGLALILALGWCLLRQRRKIRRLEQQQQAEQQQAGPAEPYPYLVGGGSPCELKAEEIQYYLPEVEGNHHLGQRSELDTVKPVEMPAF